MPVLSAHTNVNQGQRISNGTIRTATSSDFEAWGFIHEKKTTS